MTLKMTNSKKKIHEGGGEREINAKLKVAQWFGLYIQLWRPPPTTNKVTNLDECPTLSRRQHLKTGYWDKTSGFYNHVEPGCTEKTGSVDPNTLHNRTEQLWARFIFWKKKKSKIHFKCIATLVQKIKIGFKLQCPTILLKFFLNTKH